MISKETVSRKGNSAKFFPLQSPYKADSKRNPSGILAESEPNPSGIRAESSYFFTLKADSKPLQSRFKAESSIFFMLLPELKRKWS